MRIRLLFYTQSFRIWWLTAKKKSLKMIMLQYLFLNKNELVNLIQSQISLLYSQRFLYNRFMVFRELFKKAKNNLQVDLKMPFKMSQKLVMFTFVSFKVVIIPELTTGCVLPMLCFGWVIRLHLYVWFYPTLPPGPVHFISILLSLPNLATIIRKKN
jgi:hypothetical protein